MSTALDIEKIVCPQCYTMLDVGDNFCRQCGVPTGSLAPSLPLPARGVPDHYAGRPGWSENVWVVLAMLFFVLGPLALPMLWRSRCFSPTWKLILTAVMLVVTVVMLWWMWHTVQEALKPLRELDF